MARTSVEDPLKVFRFIVEIDGMARAGFSECTGLKRTTDEAEYREGGDNETPKKSAGLSKFGDITLKRGQILDEGQNDLYSWSQEVHDVASKGGSQRDYRREIDIVQFERGGLEVCRWRVYESWVKESTPFSDLSGLSSENSYESVVIAHEGYNKVS